MLESVREWPPAITYLTLFFGSLIEYIVPPVPGDTIVVAGAVLVGAFGWSVWPVFVVVTAGAVVGAIADFYIGKWLVNTGRVDRLGDSAQLAVRDLVSRFERHGAWYLAVNRFLPGIRAFFFVAAGLAGLKLRVVVFWSTISAMAWNALLVAAGMALGSNLEELELWLDRYQLVMWGMIVVVLAIVAYKVRGVITRARRGAPDPVTGATQPADDLGDGP